MIICSVEAKNFQKYQSIRLDKLPEKGLIAVTGLNESGKSTIGEMICFALFGRSFSVNENELTRLVKWNEDKAEVNLEFVARDGNRYRLERCINDLGIQNALLKRMNSELEWNDSPSIYVALLDIIGFGYDEFVESFYLAQREIVSPNAHSDIVKRIAGISRYEKALHQLQQDSDKLNQQIEAYQARQGELGVHITNLAVSSDDWNHANDALAKVELDAETVKEKLIELKDRQQEVSAQHGAVERAMQALMQVGVHASYQRWHEHLQALLTETSELSLTLPESEAGESAFMALGGFREELVDLESRLATYERICGLLGERRSELTIMLGEPSAQLLEAGPGNSIKDTLDRQQKSHQRHRRFRDGFGFFSLLFIVFALMSASDIIQLFGIPAAVDFLLAALFGVLAAYNAMRYKTEDGDMAATQGRLNTAQKEASQLDQLDIARLEDALDFLETYQDSRIRDSVHNFRQGEGLALITESGVERVRDRFRAAAKQLQESIKYLAEMMAGDIKQAQSRVDEQMVLRQERLNALSELERRQSEVDRLTLECKAVEGMVVATEADLAANVQARAWLSGMIGYVSDRFNRDVKKLAGRVLPALTQERYQYVQLDEQLQVRVFSNDKQDFVGIEELSSGTQRQLMLALRLAMCQELVKTTGQNEQFVFLDEPFAFFDAERTKNSLKSLPNLTSELAQIWVVAQEFPSMEYFDVHLSCVREEVEFSMQ